MEANQETQMPPRPQGDACGCLEQRCWWITPLVLLVVLAAMFTVWAFRQDDDSERGDAASGPGESITEGAAGASKSPTAPPQGKTVSLAVDFGNGVTRTCSALPWRPGMTVSKMLDGAARFQPGLRFDRQGEGESAFLQSIEGIVGEGQGGRNWIYYVENARGQRGMGVRELKPGDAVLWKYEPYE